MELELKHLAPYLPYKPRVILGSTERDLTAVSLDSKYVFVTAYKSSREKQMAGIESIKPILRTLTDLTTEIEHNGERFVPIQRINNFKKLSTGKHSGGKFEYDTEGICDRVINHDLSFGGGGSWEGGYERDIDSLQFYKLYDLLFQWHFDVFGLIEEGLAIDINTLNKN